MMTQAQADAALAQVRDLITGLDDPNLTEDRWRAAYAKASPLIESLEFFELAEPFLMTANLHGWKVGST